MIHGGALKENKGTKQRLEKLFNTYTENLSNCFPQAVGIFICPICQRNFFREALDREELSLEHIIPESLGGKWTTLTCKECNSKQGAKLESHLKRRLESEDVLSGKSDLPIRSKIQIGDGEFAADVYLSSETPNVQIVGLPHLSNPNLHLKAIKGLESGLLDIKMAGSLGYKELPSRVAVLRIAYLMMFSIFGYGYIQANTLDIVRDQITDFNKEQAPLNGVVVLNDSKYVNRVGLLTYPTELRCFFVVVRVNTKYSYRDFGVALPGLDKTGFTLYDRWKENLTKMVFPSNGKIDILDFDPALITDTRLKFASKAIWDGHIKIGS